MMIWKRKLFLGITIGETTAVIGFYLFMALSYNFTIAMISKPYLKPGEELYSWWKLTRELIDYSIKLVLTIPVWWLLFRVMKGQPFWKKLLMHLVTLPIFIFSWKSLYYYFCDRMGHPHLSGPLEVWDVYIPTLFYVMQFCFFHLYEHYRAFQREQRTTTELRELALQTEMQSLKAQIQPHFLFNTLNSISASVPANLERTRELIARLAETFRFALQASEHEVVPLKHELEFVKAYLELEKERFSDRLQLHYEIDESLLDIPVPPMILQPLIENAIKHGIAGSVEGGSITISIQRLDKYARVSISDSGPGLRNCTPEKALQKGIGLRNTHQRLLKYYGQPIHFSVNQPSGVKVYFELPIKRNDR